MPEEMEVQTENVHETVNEAVERKSDWLHKAIALTTALLAVLATIAALRAAATVNEALMLKAEATRHQAEAADQWAYYQAKGIKAAVQEASRTAWIAIGKEPPADFKEAVKRYGDDNKQTGKIAGQRNTTAMRSQPRPISYSISIIGMPLAWQFSKWQSH